MASVEKIKSGLKAWQARDGSVRYYVNDWKQIIGLHVEHYKSGNVSEVWFDDSVDDGAEGMSNNYYNKYVSRTKVWFDEQARIHIDYLDDDGDSIARDRILKLVDAAYSAPAEAPRTPRQLMQVSLCAFL